MEKKPFLTEEMAQAIIEDVPTPFHVYDEKGIRENARRINKAFSWNKGFKEYFAVKALPNPVILQILKEEGCGVDCSSLTELMLSEACGFSGSDIMFSSNQTPVEDMKKAYELGAYINLDDATMVEFLERVAGVPENIFCRYNPGGTFSLGESEEGFQVMDKPGDAKYGMTEEQMIESYKKLAAKGAKNFGIHAFLASNTISDEYYPELAGILFQLAVRVQKATGVHIGYINLSGGVGIPYRPEQTENDIMAIGEGVRKKFEEILVPAGMGDVAIFTEMGRFTTGPYGALVATAIHEKHIYKEYIGLDACAANLMRPAMYGAYHHITVLGKENAPCDHMYDVVGGLCENNDKFAIDRMLPKVTVIYEDENIAVLYKPTHLLCHSDRTGDANLVDAFTQYLAEKGEYDPHGENRFKPGVCNRLDRGTEGLVIAAKSYAALRDMNEIIRTDLLKKEYYTITVGIPQSGRFTAWWEHDEKNNKVSIHVHQSQDERRKQIITDVDVLRTAGPFALCKIGLITGRTHQIRAHLAYLGRPVLGDIKYGNRKMNERTGTKTQALCAVRISFLDIPEENTLHYLSGKVIKLKDPQIVKQFDALDKNKTEPAKGE